MSGKNLDSKQDQEESTVSSDVQTVVRLRDGWEANCANCKHTVEEHELVNGKDCPFCEFEFTASVW